MATPLNPSSTSDIGPLSASSALGEPGRAPASDAAAASAKKSRADSGEPVIEPSDEAAADEQASELNGASATNGDAAPLAQERSPAAVENNKEAEKAPAAPTPTPATTTGEEAGRQGAGVGKPWPRVDYSKELDEIERQLRERMRARYGSTLVSDMEDAQLLLSYVTRNGLQEDRKVADSTIQTLIAAREHMRRLEFDSEKEEASFRKSYGVIAKAAEPVTVASLRDSTRTEPYTTWPALFTSIFKRSSSEQDGRPSPEKRRSGEREERPIADIACLRYRSLAILVLFTLLIVQIYWTISSSVLNKTDALIAEINKAPSNQYYLAKEKARVTALEAANQPKPVAAATVAAAPSPSPQPTPEQARGAGSELTLDELVSKIGELNASYEMLRRLMFFGTEEPGAAGVIEHPGAGPEEPATKKEENIFQPSHFQIESAAIRTVAGQVVDVMQKWLLPLLYGALGAMVFVVRTLSMQARDRLFRKEALVSLVLRVYLGMISGLAIGWFWNHNPAGPTTAGALTPSTLSPFALAFVAGYGVELFFALLDKIVSTFTNK
jgi:hypothetical protein